MGSVTVYGKSVEEMPLTCGTLRMSFAYCCPNCGRLWARIRRGKGWYFVARWCADCPRQEVEVNGSLFQNYDWQESGTLETFLAANRQVLRHEVNAHLNWAAVPNIEGVSNA